MTPEPESVHPPRRELEAAAFGWLPLERATAVRAHAATCTRCGPLLAAEDEVRRRLMLLRADEPHFNLVGPVLQRIAALDAAPPPRHGWPFRWLPAAPARAAAAVVLAIALAGAVALAPARLQAAARWLRAVVVREVPPPGAPGSPKVVTPGPGAASPLRQAGLEEARRSVPFPVGLPLAVPAGFELAEVAVFRPRPDAAPTQVFVTYRRAGTHQPLVLTYQAPGTTSEVRAAPGAARELEVNGRRAVYVDAAAEGARAIGGEDMAQLGRLILERPDVVLTAAGDRRDGLDAGALAAVLASVP